MMTKVRKEKKFYKNYKLNLMNLVFGLWHLIRVENTLYVKQVEWNFLKVKSLILKEKVYKMYKMYFNTGVKPENRPNVPLMKHQVFKGGVLQIIFYLESEPPKDRKLLYLTDHIDHLSKNLLCIPVVDGGMNSKYAVFI